MAMSKDKVEGDNDDNSLVDTCRCAKCVDQGGADDLCSATEQTAPFESARYTKRCSQTSAAFCDQLCSSSVSTRQVTPSASSPGDVLAGKETLMRLPEPVSALVVYG